MKTVENKNHTKLFKKIFAQIARRGNNSNLGVDNKLPVLKEKKFKN